MSKKLTPFSKEHLDYPTVSNTEGQRSGFADHYTITNCGREEMSAIVKGRDMSNWQQGQHSHNSGEENKPAFKARSDDGQPEFPAAFSKKIISGGPAHPGTPA